MMSSQLALAIQQYWDHMDDSGGWIWLWGTLGMLLFVVALGVVVWVVTRATPPRRAAPVDRAQEILAERYARGELSTEEYRERLDALRGRPIER